MTDTLLERLQAEGLSLLVIDESGERYRSTSTGVRPLLELVDRFPAGLPGATAADRIVGACAARVFALLRFGRVLGLTGSQAAAAILDVERISWQFCATVSDIPNRAGDGVCPFELLSRAHQSATTLIPAMRDLLAGPTSRGGSPAREQRGT